MSGEHIVLVEYADDLREFVRFIRACWLSCDRVRDAAQAFEVIHRERPALVITDLWPRPTGSI